MNLAFTLNGEPVTLMASCMGDGDTGGGLLYYDGQAWICIDDVSTSGLYATQNELIRILWAPRQVADSTSILHYTRDGFARQVTIEGFTDPHDVLWDGRHYVAVSSFQDLVLWVTADGTIKKRFQPAGGGDCWHLNSLLSHDGVLFAAAFGRSEQPRAWAGNARKTTGVIFRLDTQEDVLTGLCRPHTPRVESGQWIVCNSARSELNVFTGIGKLVKSVGLKDWVRGLALTDRYVLVGESVNRQLTRETRGATVAVLDRKTWALIGRLKLPFREVYDLVLVPRELLDGILRSPGARSVALCPAEIPRPKQR
jgi:Domain of unknown function (DUF4915)